MAAGEDYLYCTVCRRNHNDGRKHIFTRQHKKRLVEIIDKFAKKVREARRLLQNPNVVDGELEPESTLWCYCCQEEIQKHVSDGLTTIEWGGLLEHMSSSSHHKKTRHYWWENGIESGQLQNFILFQAELDRFKSLVLEKLEKLKDKKERNLKKEIKAIEENDKQRLQIALEPPPSLLLTKPISSQGSCTSNESSLNEKLRGNVHTGATPPWLRDEDEDDDGTFCHKGPIGPSEEDFMAWNEKQGKGKKNPKRVGADFHRNLKKRGLLDKDDDSWLPSFGRVWNSGPRSHSKFEFQSEFIPASSSSSDIETTTDHVKPYIRKRTLKRPHPNDAMPD